jgi:hypothetical protein
MPTNNNEGLDVPLTAALQPHQESLADYTRRDRIITYATLLAIVGAAAALETALISGLVNLTPH